VKAGVGHTDAVEGLAPPRAARRTGSAITFSMGHPPRRLLRSAAAGQRNLGCDTARPCCSVPETRMGWDTGGEPSLTALGRLLTPLPVGRRREALALFTNGVRPRRCRDCDGCRPEAGEGPSAGWQSRARPSHPQKTPGLPRLAGWRGHRGCGPERKNRCADPP